MAITALNPNILGHLIEQKAKADPDRLVLIFENDKLPDERVTYRDLYVQGNKIAAELSRQGLKSGDKVAIMMRNHPEFIYGMVGASVIGAVVVPVDPRARGEKLKYFLTFSDSKSVLTTDYVVQDPDVEAVFRKAGVRPYVLRTAEGMAQGIGVRGNFAALNEVLSRPDEIKVENTVDDQNATWQMAFTSGTTGDPKGIRIAYARMGLYRVLGHFFGYRPDDVLYTGLSLTHGNAQFATMMQAVLGTVHHAVLSRWFTKSRIWDICIKYGCTSWSNLGGIATAVYSEPPGRKDQAHKVRMIISAGMPAAIWERFEERFNLKILEWYGAMEGGFACKPIGEGPVGSFGKPPQGVIEMKVVDENGQECPPRAIGELVGRAADGSAPVVDYYKNPEASRKKTEGGWLRTGDMAWRDEEGWFFFAHRQSDGGIRKMGEFISADFIQRVVAEHAQVLDVHIYGVPALSGAPGEKDVVAAVVAAEPGAALAKELFDVCARDLEKSHVPDFIQFCKDLPKTSSEKVQERFLSEAFSPGSNEVFSREAAGGKGIRGGN
jgi:crotonobetaine/carnitine-CoA ligase